MKTVIEMAKEAGFACESDGEIYIDHRDGVCTKNLNSFAELVRADEREICAKTKAGKPRKLKPVGLGTLLGEQQFCFEKGWREGAASVRLAILAKGSNT